MRFNEIILSVISAVLISNTLRCDSVITNVSQSELIVAQVVAKDVAKEVAQHNHITHTDRNQHLCKSYDMMDELLMCLYYMFV